MMYQSEIISKIFFYKIQDGRPDNEYSQVLFYPFIL